MTAQRGDSERPASVVTVTPTIGDGTVVRWYASEAALDYMQPIVSASRNGVLGHGGDYITGELFKAAWDAHQRLITGLDVTELATHCRRGLLGPYERITHTPCCSTHGVGMTCARYRRTHFVEVRPCCSVDAEDLRACAPEEHRPTTTDKENHP